MLGGGSSVCLAMGWFLAGFVSGGVNSPALPRMWANTPTTTPPPPLPSHPPQTAALLRS